MGSGVQRNQEEKANIWGTFCVFKWMKTLSLRVSSFALTSICFIIFLFYLHFCLLSNLEIIRCIVKSMIAPSMYLLLKYSWKKKTWKSFLGTRIRAPKLVYWSPKWPEYVPCKTSSEKNWPYLLTRIIWIMKEILNSLQIII